ncbi:hypothetical protein [Rhizobium sp. SG2393]|uniref:hypothetical protein n=1 Tax=Rhizobium sp. SG2393 TaxID=3276279 RepID=UPI0036711D05
MDTMVALEAKPLPALPWSEIDSVGPILVLVVPQVNVEIDKRKRDGRVGKRARDFNRLITPAAVSGKPARISDTTPAVDIAVARTSRVDWNKLDDLDPDEGDAKVVAQIIHAIDVAHERKILLSQDINPISMASRHGLRCWQLPDNWLIEPEPSPHEKEVARLKARVRELESSEPQIEANVTFGVQAPVETFRISPLSPSEQKALVARLVSKHPRILQRTTSYLGGIGHDFSYDDKYDAFIAKSLPLYASQVHRFFETQYGQVPFQLTISNEGSVQAENLVVHIEASGGTIHNKFTVHRLFGPIVPRPEPHRFRIYPNIEPGNFRPIRVGRHDMNFAFEPDGGTDIEFNCQDFRHGRNWRFDGVGTIAADTVAPLILQVTVSASNMRGVIKKSFQLDSIRREAQLAELVDVMAKHYNVPFPMSEQFHRNLNDESKDWFDFVELEQSPRDNDTD